jgi:hypothetical protein
MGNMERNQVGSSGQRETAELPGKHSIPVERGCGEGAASALAFMKRIERDRAAARPADERPAS